MCFFRFAVLFTLYGWRFKVFDNRKQDNRKRNLTSMTSVVCRFPRSLILWSKCETNIEAKLLGYIEDQKYFFLNCKQISVTKFHILKVVSVPSTLCFVWPKKYLFRFLQNLILFLTFSGQTLLERNVYKRCKQFKEGRERVEGKERPGRSSSPTHKVHVKQIKNSKPDNLYLRTLRWHKCIVSKSDHFELDEVDLK